MDSLRHGMNTKTADAAEFVADLMTLVMLYQWSSLKVSRTKLTAVVDRFNLVTVSVSSYTPRYAVIDYVMVTVYSTPQDRDTAQLNSIAYFVENCGNCDRALTSDKTMPSGRRIVSLASVFEESRVRSERKG